MENELESVKFLPAYVILVYIILVLVLTTAPPSKDQMPGLWGESLQLCMKQVCAQGSLDCCTKHKNGRHGGLAGAEGAFSGWSGLLGGFLIKTANI